MNYKEEVQCKFNYLDWLRKNQIPSSWKRLLNETPEDGSKEK